MENEVTEILTRFKSPGVEKLIPILLEIQEELGFLSEEAIPLVAKYLKMAPSKVFGVATFYNNLNFKPKGKYHIKVCNGSNCHLENSVHIVNDLKKNLKIEENEVTADGFFSLEVTSCLGGCAQSPVVVINDEYYTQTSSGKIREIIDNLKKTE